MQELAHGLVFADEFKRLDQFIDSTDDMNVREDSERSADEMRIFPHPHLDNRCCFNLLSGLIYNVLDKSYNLIIETL